MSLMDRSLADLQSEIARCLVAPEAIDDALKSTLHDFSPQELHAAAETLVRKRVARLRHTFPRTSRSMGTTFGERCRQAFRNRGNTTTPSLEDDIDALGRELRGDRLVPQLAIEAYRWECLRHESMTRHWAFRWLVTRYGFESEERKLHLWCVVKIFGRGKLWKLI
jgi:anti-sigma factor RsiW